MKLWYLYARTDPTTSADTFRTEGHCYLFQRMLAEGTIDACTVVVDGGPEHTEDLGGGVQWRAVGNFVDLIEVIQPGDIVWVRAGFKPTDLYEWCNERHIWLLYYGANIGRERWRFWDIIFEDVERFRGIDSRGILWMNFPKPIHPEIFKPLNLEQKYDVCLGASHVHDKKGQYRGIQMLQAYEKFSRRKLKIIMPGGIRHSEHTNGILDDIKHAGLDVEMPGFVSRQALAEIFNISKVFLHFGSGQNDRSIHEAMRCGCPAYVDRPQYHAPYAGELLTSGVLTEVLPIADTLREETFEKHERHAGIEPVILPIMRRLFGWLRDHPAADRRLLPKLMEVSHE